MRVVDVSSRLLRGRAVELARRAVAASGVEEVLRLQLRVEVLEEAVAENTALEAPLVDVVGRLEQQLVPLLELRHPDV